jgi:hypothetical protein
VSQFIFILEFFCLALCVLISSLIVRKRWTHYLWWLWLSGPLAFIILLVRSATSYALLYHAADYDYLLELDRLWLPIARSFFLVVFMWVIYWHND